MYRVYTDADGDANADTCKARCAFDYDTITQDPNDLGCQFWAFNGTFCYLGSMGYERSVHVASDPLTLNLLESEVVDMVRLFKITALLHFFQPTLEVWSGGRRSE